MQGNFTEKAREAITKAQQYAVHLGHNYVGTEHILLGLVGVKDSVASKAIEAQGVSEEAITEKIEELVRRRLLSSGFYTKVKTRN